MRRRVKNSIIAVILATVMFMYGIPVEFIQVMADSIGNILTNDSSIEQQYYPGGLVDEYNIGKGNVVQENIQNRSFTTKEFLMSDNTIMVQQYIEPVHYFEEGEFKEIDNTLTVDVQNGEKIYKNSSNSFNVKFYDSDSFDSEIFEIEEDGYLFEFEYKEKSFENSEAEITDSRQEIAQSISKPCLTIEDMPKGQIASDFANDQTHVVYEVKNNKLNNNIIIEEEQEEYSYTYEINSSNLEFVKGADGNITAYNTNGEAKFLILVPYITDVQGGYSNAVSYTLTEENGKTGLTITADNEWINENAVLPVTITSEIKSLKNNEFSFSNIYENGNIIENAEQVYVGKKNGSEKSDIFFSFELPDVEPYYQLIGAVVNFEYETKGMGLLNGKNLYYDVYVAESTQDLSEITYSDKPEKIQMLNSIRRKSQYAQRQSIYESNIININNLKDNVMTIGVEPTEEMSEDSYIAIATAASENTGAIYWYEQVIGLEDDYSMESFEISGASASINNGTGQLNAVFDLISVNTLSEIPFSANLIYNDYYNNVLSSINKTSIAGNNFKLNFQQFMISRGSVYELIDADGSISTFYSINSGLYYSKEKKLYYNPNTNIAYDVSGNQMKFVNGRLTEISSQNNPTEYIQVQYSGNTSDQISQVKYYANSVLKHVMNFNYSGNKIAYVTTNVDATNTNKIVFEYDADGNLISLKNQTGNMDEVQIISLGYHPQLFSDDPVGMLNYVFDNLKNGIIFDRDFDDTIYEVRKINAEDVNGQWRCSSRVSFDYYGIYTKIYYYENSILTKMHYVSFNNTKKVISEWQEDSNGIVSVSATTNWRNENNLTENYTEEICGYYHRKRDFIDDGISPNGNLVKTINSAMLGVDNHSSNRYAVIFKVIISDTESEIAKGLNLSVKIGDNAAENIILNQGGHTYVCIPCGYYENDTSVTITNNGTGYVVIAYFNYSIIDSVQQTNTYNSAINAHTLTASETNLKSGNYVQTTYDNKQRVVQTQTLLLGNDNVQETKTYSYYGDNSTNIQKGKIKEAVTVDETGLQVEKTEYAYTGTWNNYTETVTTTQGSNRIQNVYQIERTSLPYVVTQTDENNIETKAYYQVMNGDIRLEKVISDNSREEYEYNNLGQIINIEVYEDSTNTLIYSQTDNYDVNGVYTGSEYGGTSYTYGYDDTGYITSISAGTSGGTSTDMIEYFYNSHGESISANKLFRKMYANGNVEDYTYSTSYIGSSTVYKTQVEHKNSENGSSTGKYVYDYNSNGEMTGQSYWVNGMPEVMYDYGDLDNLDSQTLTIDCLQYHFEYTVNYDKIHNRVERATIYSLIGCTTTNLCTINYDYNTEGQLSGMSYDSFQAEYGYDRMGRLTNRTTGGNYNVQDEEYTYRTYTKNGVTYNTNQLVSINDNTYNGEDRTATYDDSGNITGISYNGNSYTYTYDAAGRLTQEKKNGIVQNNYSYDNANNIQASGLTYTNGKLTAVNGKTISYDAMGNPTTYKGQTFTWGQGRKLTSGTMNGNTFTYSYDGNGMRYEKIVNGIRSDYYYNDTQLLMENRNGTRIYYIYGATGIEGFVIRDIFGSQCYYFDKNTMGDIVAIRQHSNIGNIVATYEYDAWGNVTVKNAYGTSETSSDFIGNINPFRYRGYYYDTETGFYYLQTRYYDPETYRFINADDYELVMSLSEVVGQLNMYAYCNNNPVMFVDPTGEFVLTFFIVGAIMGAAFGALNAHLNNEDILLGALTGGIVGALTGGFQWGAVLTAVANSVSTIITDFYNYNTIYLDKVLYNGITSGVLGGIFGSMANQISTDVANRIVGAYVINTVSGGLQTASSFMPLPKLSIL